MRKFALLLLFMVMLSVSVSAYSVRIYPSDAYKDGENICRVKLAIKDSGGSQASDTYELKWDYPACSDGSHCEDWQRVYTFEESDETYQMVIAAQYWSIDSSTESDNKCYIKFSIYEMDYDTLSSWTSDISWSRNSCSSSDKCTNENGVESYYSRDIGSLDDLESGTAATQTRINVTCNIPETTLSCPAPDMSLVPACPTCTCNTAECPDCTCPPVDFDAITDKPLNIKIDFLQVLILAIAVIGAGVASYLLGKQGGSGNTGGPQQRSVQGYNQYPPSR